MATGTTLINRALRSLKVLASGASPTSAETADALVALNSMLESWRNDGLLVYAAVDSSLTMVSTQSSYTIGTSGDLNITRPVKIESAFMRISGVDTPVRMLDESEWYAIPDKTVTSTLVECAFYNPTMASSQGTLLVYPVPTAANVLHLIHWIVLASLSAAGDTVTLPPGYDRAISLNLALDLADEFDVTPSALLVKNAKDALAQIKRRNSKPILMRPDLAATINGQGSSILYGL